MILVAIHCGFIIAIASVVARQRERACKQLTEHAGYQYYKASRRRAIKAP